MGTLSPLSFHFYCIYFEVLGDFIFLPSAIESFRNKSSCYKEVYEEHMIGKEKRLRLNMKWKQKSEIR